MNESRISKYKIYMDLRYLYLRYLHYLRLDFLFNKNNEPALPFVCCYNHIHILPGWNQY